MEKYHKPHTLQQVRQSSKNRKIRKKKERKGQETKRKCVESNEGKKDSQPQQLKEQPESAVNAEHTQSSSLSSKTEPKNDLAAEKERLYRHAVYFHSMWKQSVKPTELDEHMLQRKEQIGSGTFGVCFKGTFGNLDVCIKDFPANMTDEGIYEAKVLQKLRHPHLPLFIGIVSSKESGKCSVVTKFHGISGNSVSLAQACSTENEIRKMIDKSATLVSLFMDTANALEYIHESEGILHNDIKGNNVVLENHGDELKAIIIDFGKSCLIRDGKTYRQCNRQRYPHLAPEFAKGGTQSRASDIFSFGYMLRVVSHKLDNFICRAIYKRCVDHEPEFRPDAKAIVSQLQKHQTC